MLIRRGSESLHTCGHAQRLIAMENKTALLYPPKSKISFTSPCMAPAVESLFDGNDLFNCVAHSSFAQVNDGVSIKRG